MKLVLSANAVVSNLRAGFPRGATALCANSLQTYYVHAVGWRSNTSSTSAAVHQMFCFAF